MISVFLKSALCALKLIVFATILYFILCVFAFALFIYMMAHDAGFDTQKTATSDPKPVLALPATKERIHNQTEVIQNGILTTHAPKKQKQTKAKKQHSKPSKPQPTATKPFKEMTAKELLAYAKEEKIKGYTSAYRTGKKPGLLKLIEQQPEFS